jgi:hypothetical protein
MDPLHPVVRRIWMHRSVWHQHSLYTRTFLAGCWNPEVVAGFPHLILLSLSAKEDIFQDAIVPASLFALTIDASAQSRGVLQQ